MAWDGRWDGLALYPLAFRMEVLIYKYIVFDLFAVTVFDGCM